MTTQELTEGPAHVWRIEPLPPTVAGQVSAVFKHRALLWFFAVESIFELHRGAMLGTVWMIARPLTIAIPAVFVGKMLGISVEPVPLALFVLVSLAGWTLVRRALMNMTKSLIRARAVMQQVYVPALVLLIAASAPGFCEAAVVLVVAAVAAIYFGPIQGSFYIPIGLPLLGVIPAVALTFMLVLALGCFTSFLNAVARDTQLIQRYMLGGWMLVTPVLYPIDVIPESHHWIFYLNPMTAVMELYRWSLLGYGTLHWQYLLLATVETSALLLIGLWFFSRQQNRLFDHM
jgi:lipopolysaccharide transport system permease protein